MIRLRNSVSRIGPLTMLSLLTILGAAPTPVAVGAAAVDPHSAILARQDGFKKIGRAMKALMEQLKTDAPARPAMAEAAGIIFDTAKRQGNLFPAGSGASSGIKTDALPLIWADKAKFDGAMSALVTASGKLVGTINGGNLDAIRAQTKAMGTTCATCHRQFRQDD